MDDDSSPGKEDEDEDIDTGLSEEPDFEDAPDLVAASEEPDLEGTADLVVGPTGTHQKYIAPHKRPLDRVGLLQVEDKESRHSAISKGMKERHVGLYGPPLHIRDLEFNAVCIIHTGGTIGMRPKSEVDQQLVSAPHGTLLNYIRRHPAFSTSAARIFSEEELWLMEDRTGLDKFKDQQLPLLIVVECASLIDSTNATFKTWNEIAARIWSRRLLYKSFVITHGTDSLAYTACALTFMLGQKKSCIPPIVITGSQVPIYSPLTDGLNNLLGACCAAGWVWQERSYPAFDVPWPEVTVYFDNKLMLGSRVVKKDAQNLDAFETPNKGVLAVFSGGKFHKQEMQLGHLIHKRTIAQAVTRGRLGCFLIHSSVSVRILYVAPDCVRSWGLPVVDGTMTQVQKEVIAKKLLELEWDRLKGVIVCAYGAGNAPGSVQNILRVLRAQFGVPVGVLTECFSGSAEQVYETAIQDAGVTLEDMTLPAAYTKMAILAGRAIANKRTYIWVEQCMIKPIRGEFTHNSAYRLKSDNVSSRK